MSHRVGVLLLFSSLASSLPIRFCVASLPCLPIVVFDVVSMSTVARLRRRRHLQKIIYWNWLIQQPLENWSRKRTHNNPQKPRDSTRCVAFEKFPTYKLRSHTKKKETKKNIQQCTTRKTYKNTYAEFSISCVCPLLLHGKREIRGRIPRSTSSASLGRDFHVTCCHSRTQYAIICCALVRAGVC